MRRHEKDALLYTAHTCATHTGVDARRSLMHAAQMDCVLRRGGGAVVDWKSKSKKCPFCHKIKVTNQSQKSNVMQSTPKSKSKNRISWPRIKVTNQSQKSGISWPRIKVTNQSQRSGNFVLDDWFYAENKGHRLMLKKHTRGVLGVGTRQWQADVCVVGTEMRVTWSFGVHIMRSPSVRRACQGPSCVDTCVCSTCVRDI